MYLEYLQNPRKHRENMKTQKSPRLVSNPGLWGDSANHLTTVPPPPLNPICQCINTSEFVCFYTFTSEFMKWWRSPHSEWWMCEAVNNCREGKRTSTFFLTTLCFSWGPLPAVWADLLTEDQNWGCFSHALWWSLKTHDVLAVTKQK